MSLCAKTHSQESPLEIPRSPELRGRIDLLRRRARQNGAHPLSDAVFDEILPAQERELSYSHWTPIEVVRAAVSFLVGDRIETRVLDVGSGVGKFCLAGALLSKGRFFGIEQRARFCGIARALVDEYGIPRASFLHGSHRELDWSVFEAIYLFNPFQENKTPEQRLDDSVPLDRELFRRYTAITVNKLSAMRAGTRVATYHGFGAALPASYVRERCQWLERGPLELWTKLH